MNAEFKAELAAMLPRLRRFALTKVFTAEAADDLVQLTCERAWNARDKWVPGTRMDSWLFTIMQNLYIDQVRADSARGVVEDSDALDLVPDLLGARRLEARVTLEQVMDAMRRLPQPMRDVLALVVFEDLTRDEAAAVLNIPVGTVMSRLARARVELMRRLQLQAGDTGEETP